MSDTFHPIINDAVQNLGFNRYNWNVPFVNCLKLETVTSAATQLIFFISWQSLRYQKMSEASWSSRTPLHLRLQGLKIFWPRLGIKSLFYSRTLSLSHTPSTCSSPSSGWPWQTLLWTLWSTSLWMQSNKSYTNCMKHKMLQVQVLPERYSLFLIPQILKSVSP